MTWFPWIQFLKITKQQTPTFYLHSWWYFFSPLSLTKKSIKKSSSGQTISTINRPWKWYSLCSSTFLCHDKFLPIVFFLEYNFSTLVVLVVGRKTFQILSVLLNSKNWVGYHTIQWHLSEMITVDIDYVWLLMFFNLDWAGLLGIGQG